jgi:small-conductance mechanosensitive channel
MSNIWLTWGDVFNASLQNLWWGFIQFTPKLILAIVFFVIGWALGSLVAKAFEQVFSSLKIDGLFRSIGVDSFFRKAGMNLNSGYFVGQVIKWFVIIIFLLPSLNLVGLDYIAGFLKDDVLGFLPRVIVAAFVLIIATIVADFLSKTVMAGSRAMNLKSTNMLGSLVKYTVWVFAFIIALGQLGVAEGYMNTLFAGIIGMLAVAGALAFGLGGKDAAGRLISKLGEEMSHKEY